MVTTQSSRGEGWGAFKRIGGLPGKGHNKCLQLFIPQDVVCSILQQLQDAPSGSHLGVTKIFKTRSVLISIGLGSDGMWRIGASHGSYVQNVNPLPGNGRLNCGQNSPAIHSNGHPGTTTSICERQ